MSKTESGVLEEITRMLDGRLAQLINIQRVVHSYRGHILENTVSSMGLPMIYAHWEGFVKEILQVYVEYVESTGLISKEYNPAILAYSWTPYIRRLKGDLKIDNQILITNCLLSCLTETITFESEQKEIDTKSNLKYEILIDILKKLALDHNLTNIKKHKINELVGKRNYIAHGGFSDVIDIDDIDDYIDKIIKYIGEIEEIVIDGIKEKKYITVP